MITIISDEFNYMVRDYREGARLFRKHKSTGSILFLDKHGENVNFAVYFINGVRRSDCKFKDK